MAENVNATNKAAAWFRGLKAEFKKIIWPDGGSLTRQTIAVVVTSIVTGLLIAVIDVIVQYGVDFLVGINF